MTMNERSPLPNLKIYQYVICENLKSNILSRIPFLQEFSAKFWFFVYSSD